MARPVRWDLIADPTRYVRGFDTAERRSRRFQQHTDRVQKSAVRFSSTVGSIGPVAVRAFGGAAVAAGGLAVAGAALGLKTAANLETAQVGFTRLLGSAKQARSFLGQLKTFAAKTPFELPGLVDASRALVGAGTAAKDVIPILTSLGDASGALGLDQERFGRVMVAVTQIMNRGKVQSEELMQITEAGIPVWQLLAKATGKPVPELQKLMQQGKLLAKDVLPKLFQQMRKDYGGGMAQQSKTLAGIWSTFKDTISLTLAEGLQPLLPMLKTALPQAAEFFQRTVQGVTRFLRADLGPELGRVKQAWDDSKASILGYVTSLDGSRSSMMSTKDAISGLATALEELIRGGGELAKPGGFLERADGHFRDFRDSATESVTKLAELFGLRPPPEVTAWLLKVDGGLEEAADATGRATTAAQDHAAALTAEKAALQALSVTLEGERNAELNLRQAKLNVSAAQERLNELKRAGRTRSTEYKQAQINLERAQLAAKEAATQYRAAINKSNEAERVAASRAQQTRAALRELGETSIGARKRLVQFALEGSAALARLKSRRLDVTAKYNIGAPKGIELLIEKGLVRRARGGRIHGRGTATSDSIPAMLSTGEHVWSAREVQGAGGHAAVEQMRKRARGYAAGGPVLNFQQTGTEAFLARPGRFDRNIARSLELAARGFAALVRQNKDLIFGLGKPEVTRFIRSTDPLPYIWGAAGPGGYDCSGLVSAVLGKHTGAGGGHGQRYFTTSSIHSGILGIKPGLGGVLEIGVTAGTGHMAGRYGGSRGLGFEAESTATGIKIGSAASRPESFARHFHLARGGKVDQEMVARFAALAGLDIGGDAGRMRINGKVLDRGGWLMPGTTLATNRTGRPEPVGFPNVQITVNVSGVVSTNARDLADQLVPAIRSGLKQSLRRDGKTQLANLL
jgi:tape measure domain-containing protein